MMNVKTFAKDFIISYFKIRGDFFDTACDLPPSIVPLLKGISTAC